jgi:type II secretory pathway pseudopilin PulG
MPNNGDESAADATTPPKRRIWRFVGRRVIEVVVCILVLGGLFLLMWPSCRGLREAARQSKSMNNLKQIGLAIHRYDDSTGELPTNSFGPDGIPRLSWRVHILPDLDENHLYQQFKLDEPWDSPHNIQLLGRMPPVFANPKDKNVPSGKTHYRGFSNPGAVFEKRPARNRAAALVGGGLMEIKTRFSLANFKDPLTDTLLVVEADESVEWTKPDDLDASPGKPLPRLLQKQGPARGLFADGSVRAILSADAETNLPALVTHSGGEKLPPR